MLLQKFSKNLKEGEVLARTIRRDLLAGIRSLLVASLLALLDFFLLTFFLRNGGWGVLAFFLMLVAVAILAIRTFVEWQLNAFLVTNQRIIHVFQKGLFTRMVSALPYENITDVRSTVKGPLQTALGLGTIEILSTGGAEPMRLEGVRNPNSVQTYLIDLLHFSKNAATPSLSTEELVAALGKAKQELGDAAFQEILGKAKQARNKRSS